MNMTHFMTGDGQMHSVAGDAPEPDKATPRPWVACAAPSDSPCSGQWSIFGPEGHHPARWLVAHVMGDTEEAREADAKLITNAVNSYDATRAAIEKVLRIMAPVDDNERWAGTVCKILRAALAGLPAPAKEAGCSICGGAVPFPGAQFCSTVCWEKYRAGLPAPAETVSEKNAGRPFLAVIADQIIACACTCAESSPKTSAELLSISGGIIAALALADKVTL